MVKEIEVITISGQDAIGELSFALREAADTGFHPILLGTPDDYDHILEGIEEGPPPEVILEQSSELDNSQLFTPVADDAAPMTAVPSHSTAGYRGVITHLDRATGEPKARVLIRNFKAPAAWHAFAHLAWGGWSSCPAAKVHCAIHRYWAERYASVVISITSSEVQCLVANPPTDLESALQLARQHLAYCNDLAQPVAVLARTLVNARYWYFCWN